MLPECNIMRRRHAKFAEEHVYLPLGGYQQIVSAAQHNRLMQNAHLAQTIRLARHM